MIKVSIIDDHPIVTEGLQNLLGLQENIKVGACFENGKAAMDALGSESPDVVLLDINLPDISGLELCGEIKAKFPAINIIALSTHNERAVIKSMLDAGANGYVLKNALADEIIEAVHKVGNGHSYLCKGSKQVLENDGAGALDMVPFITRREKEVLHLISNGFTTQQIADQLFISTHTVESHRKKLIEKFDASNIASVVRLAAEYNML